MTSPSEPVSPKFQMWRSPEAAAIWLITAAYVVWMLCLPAFPTQDGPIHLYYTHVLKALFSNHASVYADYYRVKHLLPPYALYYYALLGLSRFVPLLLADKIIVCAYVVSFVFGFRYLARALGANADLMTLFATLVLLNWPLGMGFVNFCLSLSFAFWAIGLWLRFAGGPGAARRVLFVVLAVAVMFTHPVPLLAMLGVAGLELVARVVHHRKAWRSLPYLAADVLTLFVAACTLGYVKLFTVGRPLQQTIVEDQSKGTVSLIAHNALNYAAEKGVAFLLGPGFGPRAYRVILLVALIVPLAVAVWQMTRHRREGTWTRADAVLVLAIVAIVLMPFVPHDLNGSHFFAERLLFVIWILPMLAASGGSAWSRRARVAGIGFVVLAQAIILPVANAKLRPVAASIAAADEASGKIAAKPGEVGLVVEDERPAGAPPGLSFNPFLWGTVDILRHDDAVMANAPWLDLAIIPLGAGPRLPIDGLKPEELEFPSILRNDLMDEPPVRRNLLSSVSFVLIQQAYRPPAQGLDPLLTTDQAGWSCRTPELNWVRVCRPDR
jgi:flagellar biosynthesis protein FliQ